MSQKVHKGTLLLTKCLQIEKNVQRGHSKILHALYDLKRSIGRRDMINQALGPHNGAKDGTQNYDIVLCHRRCHIGTRLSWEVWKLKTCVKIGHSQVLNAFDDLKHSSGSQDMINWAFEGPNGAEDPKSWHHIMSWKMSHRNCILTTGLEHEEIGPKGP